MSNSFVQYVTIDMPLKYIHNDACESCGEENRNIYTIYKNGQLIYLSCCNDCINKDDIKSLITK